MNENPKRPAMEDLRGQITWDWNKHPPSEMPSMLMWYESVVKHNVPQGVTEDFYVGAYWMAGLLAQAFERGYPTHKPAILDAHLALMYYRSQEEDPFAYIEVEGKSTDTSVTTQEDADRPKTMMEIIARMNDADFMQRYRDAMNKEVRRLLDENK